MKRINLIPAEAKRTTAERWLRQHLFKSRASRIAAIITVIFIAVNLWQVSQFLRYKLAAFQGKAGIKKMQARLTHLQGTYASINAQRQQLEREARRIESRLETLQQLQTERFVWAKALSHLSSLLPQELWVNKITLNKEQVVIAGTTFDNALVGRFMARLDESEYFEQTTFNYTQKTELTDKPALNFEVVTHVVLAKVMR